MPSPFLTLHSCIDRFSEAPNCLALLDAWQRWRGGDDVTSTENVRIEELAAFMRGIAVFDVVPGESVIYRTAGALHEETYGFALKGCNLLDMVPPDGRRQILDLADAMFSTPCGYTDYREAVRSSGVKDSLISFALPLRNRDAGQSFRAVSAIDILPETHGYRDGADHTLSLAINDQFVDIGFGLPG